MNEKPKFSEPSRFYLKLPETDNFVEIGLAGNGTKLMSARIPKDPKFDSGIFDTHVDEFSFLINPDPKTREGIEQLRKMWMEDIERDIREFQRHVREFVEDALRTRVKPLLKGEITPGKIRYRGLSLLYSQEEPGFYGILQRDKILYCVDGNTYDVTSPEWKLIKCD